MSATNIFYRIPSKRGTQLFSAHGKECTLDRFCKFIFESEGLSGDDFIVANGTKVFRPNSCATQSIRLHNNSTVDILIPLLGGKGGFGSLLRAIGAQIEKTTNRDACRDLSGRRLRDIKREEELRKLIALRDKLEEEKKRRKKEKLEKLRNKTSEISNNSKPIQELVQMFDDREYNKRRLQIGDIIEAAVEKGIINIKKRQSEDGDEKIETVKKHKIDCSNPEFECSERSTPNNLNKSPHDHGSDSSYSEDERNIRSKNLWLGLEDE